jgi:hypothetical protein
MLENSLLLVPRLKLKGQTREIILHLVISVTISLWAPVLTSSGVFTYYFKSTELLVVKIKSVVLMTLLIEKNIIIF